VRVVQNLQKKKKKTLAIFTMFGSRIAYLHEQFKKNPSKLRKKTLQEQIPQVKPS
jgi:hypothetical protein